MARICFTVFFAISWVIFGSSEQLFAQPQDPPLFEVLVPQDGIFPVHDDFLQPVALRLLGDKKLYAQKVSYLVHFDGQTKEVSDALFRTVEQRGESFVEIPELSLAHFGKIGKTLELSLTVRVLFDDQESGACLTQTSETYLVYDGTAPSYEVLSEDAERLVLKIEDDTSLGEKALSLFEVNEQGGWTKTTTKTLCERVDDTEILCEVQKPQRSHERSLFVAIIQDKYANTTQVNIFKAPHFEEKLQARVTQRRELMRKRRELQREAAATTFPPPSNQISQCAAQNFALHVFHQEPAGAPTDYPDYPGARDQFLLDSFDQAVALSATAFEAHGLPGLTPHLVQDGIERIELEGEVGETPDQLLVPELDMVIFPVVFEHQSGTTGNIPYHYMLEDSTACRALFRMKESWGTQGVFDVFFIENIEGSQVGFTCRTIGAALIEFNPVVFYHPDGRWGESSFANDEYEKVGSTLLHE
ncbi:MAG: hypothetical protein KDD55_12365, partial [Bdellovibrionales bacterium]|nr:hypothetical protein [Bdellovibrionales bacterium]